ncbi:MAG: hypothetical protein MUC87_16610 [Bacteroidia bacterium]|jgi:hypothetical protein|nr:hypothetical protein [Bacteroidia bacterium]
MSKASSDQLHKLITSLTKAERRHFKIFSSRHTIGERNNYVLLFDAIAAQEQYNEEALLKRFRKEAFINQFSIAKNRLYESILRSLDVFHHNSSVDAQLWKELHYTEILYKKTLYDQCAKRLRSVKKLAQRNEKHAVLVQVQALEKLLAEKDNYSGLSDEQIQHMLDADRQVAEEIRVINDLWHVKSRLFMQLNRTGRARETTQLEHLRSLLDQALPSEIAGTHSVNARYLYHHTSSAYYFAANDYENCYTHLAANATLIEENTAIFSDEPNAYFSVLTNLIYVAGRLHRYDAVDNYLEKLRRLPEQLDTGGNEDLEIKLFSSAFSLELALYNSIGQFQKAAELAPRISEGLDKYEGRLSKIREAHFCLSLAVAFYGTGKPHIALRWITRLLNDTAIGQNEWIYAVAQLFQVILHIELDHHEVLPYVLRSVTRYFKTRNRVYQFETRFLAFAENLSQQTKATAADYNAFLQSIAPLADDPFERSAFEYFDFPAWAESKVSGKSFGEIVAAKAGAEM